MTEEKHPGGRPTDYKIDHNNTRDLIPYTNNSRTHSDEQVSQIASSINEFGFTNPVLIDDKKNIIAGHGRVMAAQKLGIETVPTITLSGLTKAQIKAYIIADNQLALNAGWDLDLLKLEIDHLKEVDFDIDLLGFDDGFIDGIINIDAEMPSLKDGDRDPFQQKTFTLHDEQAQIVEDAITKAKMDPRIDTGLNENSNGNALNWICEQWLKNE